LDLEDEFQNSINKFESLNKAFQPKVEFMINKVKFALLRKDPIVSGKIDKAKTMEGKNPVASGKVDKATEMKDLINLDSREAVPENVQESPKENFQNLTSLDYNFFETLSERKKAAEKLQYHNGVPSSDSNGSSQSQRMKSIHEAEKKMQLELDELDQERYLLLQQQATSNNMLERKYLRSKQKCEVEKARIAGLGNLDADMGLNRVNKS
jgi:hypothetical protein